MGYQFTPAYPTRQHKDAAYAAAEYFSRLDGVEAVLVKGSCARGKASPDSCLDMLALARPEVMQARRAEWERAWEEQVATQQVYRDLTAVGAFSNMELELIDGAFDVSNHYHGWTTGADEFELEVGNHVRYAVPLWEGGTYFQELQARWLPYYGEDLRRERLGMVLHYCRNNLKHIPLYAPRGLHFQCFKRFYHAFEEFLQALFIARRTYPIAYDKWVREGVVDILELPELYARLPRLLELQNLESMEIVRKAEELEELVEAYCAVAE